MQTLMKYKKFCVQKNMWEKLLANKILKISQFLLFRAQTTNALSSNQN